MNTLTLCRNTGLRALSLWWLFSGLMFVAGMCRAGAVPNHGVILLYHHVATDTPAVTSIAPSDFSAQLNYLEKHDFQVWPLPKLVAALGKNADIPDKVIAITFDDNYQSVYTQAYPQLKQRHWPFTVFVSTDAVDQGINRQASWEQLREMAAQGATVANHSASHAHLLQYLPGETRRDWEQRVSADIEKAQQRIYQETGQQQSLFAYPYGEFNRALVNLVEKLGYIGIGQHSGAAGSDQVTLAIPRFPFAGNYTGLEDFAVKVLTLPLPVQAFQAEDGPLAFDSPSPSLVLTLGPGDYSVHTLQCFGSGQGALPLQWLADRQVRVAFKKKSMAPGRSRFNCTAAMNHQQGDVTRYFWYSYPWIRTTADGRLLD